MAGGYAGRKKWQHEGVSRQETPEAWVKVAAMARSNTKADWRQADNWRSTQRPQRAEEFAQDEGQRFSTVTCSLCGAWRGWFGLEPSVQMYIEHTIEVLRAIRRVLRKDGVLWWDIDDSRHGSWGDYVAPSNEGIKPKGTSRWDRPGYEKAGYQEKPPTAARGKLHKSLCLIPQRIALAAQEDGWTVRSQIIIPTWMPESARDRPTDAYRTVLMLTKTNKPTFYWNEKILQHVEKLPKERQWGRDWYFAWSKRRGEWVRRSYWHSENYWYDGFAVRMAQSSEYNEKQRTHYGIYDISEGDFGGRGRIGVFTDGTERHGNADGLRWLGNVWGDIPPASYTGNMFAVMPLAEAERCLLASVPAEVCRTCGKARVRVVQRYKMLEDGGTRSYMPESPRRLIAGWTFCPCGERDGYEAGVVFDPFCGTGTTLLAAQKLGRRAIGIDNSEEYLKQAVTRLTVGDKGIRHMAQARRDGSEQPTLWPSPTA
ncbi:MAG: DNA methyltransferase [Dehalococcoidia bacterium]